MNLRCTLYQPKQTNYTTVPVGFDAVYINYVDTHGARHLTKKNIKISRAYKIIPVADSLNELTAKGKRLKQFMLIFSKEEQGACCINFEEWRR